MGGRTDGRTDGWADGRMGGRTETKLKKHVKDISDTWTKCELPVNEGVNRSNE